MLLTKQDMPSSKLKLVILISGGGSNLQAIIDAIEAKQLNAEIKAVLSNKKEAYGLQRALNAGIKTEVIEHPDYPDREQFDRQMIKVIDPYQPDLIVMAGFMRILSDVFIEHYEHKMINIHPSLLPKYKGLNTHQRVLDAGDREHGLTIHYVTSKLDSGPILKQVKIVVLNNDNEATLAARVLEQEHIAYPEVIQCIAKEKLLISQ